MTVAIKMLDPFVGLDVHIVQPPGPVPPVPVPHPHVGMFLDPLAFLSPKVLVNGLPAVRGGDAGMAMPPHIPIGGVFVKPPSNESELFMGSSLVDADGSPMASAGFPLVLLCQDIGMPAPVRPGKKGGGGSKSMLLPTGTVIPIPAGPPVLVGGPPSLMAFAAGKLQSKAKDVIKGKAKGLLWKGLRKLGKRNKKLRALQRKLSAKHQKLSQWLHAKADRLTKPLAKLGPVGDAIRNQVHQKLCSWTGHPVDVATGKVMTEAVDFELGGPLPLRWTRVWFSTSARQGPLGHGWHTPFDMALCPWGDDAIAVRMPDGRPVAFPRLRMGEAAFDRHEKLMLARDTAGHSIRDAGGLTFRFAPSANDPELHRLDRIEDRGGNAIRFFYDARDRLDRIMDSGGRELVVDQDEAGRIVAVRGPHPSGDGRSLPLVRYAYDDRGNLVAAWDALDQVARWTYRGHLLVRETNRNGLAFHFEWDAEDVTARCTRTWGDGGIYDHKLRYDEGVTVVEDSLGHCTTYRHEGGVVTEKIDPLGGSTRTVRNRFGEPEEEIDPLGQATRYTRDRHGNVTEIAAPDGTSTAIEYDDEDRPVRARDALGGEWSWRYDEHGRLVERRDPAGASTRFEWDARRLVAVVDPAGARTALRYDAVGSLVELLPPEGGASTWRYDVLGRCVKATDARGNAVARKLDLLGRPVEVREPDGNVRVLEYDGEGNVLRARDKQRDVRFRYGGLNRLREREERGTTVAFSYDLEERLVAIRNEHGFVYQFELDANGQVLAESGFDGVRRRYVRDAAGRVKKVERPAGRTSELVYDPLGRVLLVAHSDGVTETFEYRADGELVTARNDVVEVKFERDPAGRILKEIQGPHWIASEYDALGLRHTVRSSLGLEQRIERNRMGDVIAVRARLGGARDASAPSTDAGLGRRVGGMRSVGGSFEARFERDDLGLELERHLPGGVRAQWRRDRLGRPLDQEVSVGSQMVRSRGYHWQVNDRLQMIVDGWKGLVRYSHDELGNLTRALYEDGQVDLRLPDEVGNLFRTKERNDRQYGPAGQLLFARTPAGLVEYKYDPEGNLVAKIEPGGRAWRYEWAGSGMLAKVVRPDGAEVTFGYDALGRRVWKRFRARTTRWVWDGNVPLHEWIELDESALVHARTGETSEDDEITARKRRAELNERPAQGPPPGLRPWEGTRAVPVTWIFEPESFAPLGKLHGEEQSGIVTDHIGTPTSMWDATGRAVWSATIGVWGDLRNVEGERATCPFRWPGQYEDEETGLYYNRFRYYDPGAGQYASPDPIGIVGGLAVFAYCHDPLRSTDPLGLACQDIRQRREKVAYNFYRRAGYSHEQALSHVAGIDFSRPVSVRRFKAGTHVTQWRNPSRPVGNYFTEPGTSASQLGINPSGRVEETFVASRDTKALNSTAAPITDTWTDPSHPFDAAGGGRQHFISEKDVMISSRP